MKNISASNFLRLLLLIALNINSIFGEDNEWSPFVGEWSSFEYKGEAIRGIKESKKCLLIIKSSGKATITVGDSFHEGDILFGKNKIAIMSQEYFWGFNYTYKSMELKLEHPNSNEIFVIFKRKE